MFHDQGHIAVKVLGFETGVNATIGLPIVRTSVDHGTAFDIAGTGTAGHDSLVEAVLVGVAMSSARLSARALASRRAGDRHDHPPYRPGPVRGRPLAVATTRPSRGCCRSGNASSSPRSRTSRQRPPQRSSRCAARVRPGMTVAITAGSRGIHDKPAVVRAAGAWLRAAGAQPFVVPAMGSHGGATARGPGHDARRARHDRGEPRHADPLEHGHRRARPGPERARWCTWTATPRRPTRSSSSTASRRTPTSRASWRAAWRRSRRSGWGSSAAPRASTSTARPTSAPGSRGWPAASSTPARCSAASRSSRTPTTGRRRIELVEPDGIGGEHERRLLEEAKGLMGRLPFDVIDVAVIDVMGKDKSGAGMDTNVIGRMMIRGSAEFDRPADRQHRRARPQRRLARQRDRSGAGRLRPVPRPREGRPARQLHQRHDLGPGRPAARPGADGDADRPRRDRRRDPDLRPGRPRELPAGPDPGHARPARAAGRRVACAPRSTRTRSSRWSARRGRWCFDADGTLGKWGA